jgi:D-serine deaminase-like pyridoxal phosphate-dependent protein
MFTVDQLPADLATPCLVIDGPTVRANIARLAAYCRQYNLNLRPHAKTHKSRFIAQLQLEAGAAGLTVAKAGEAAVMAEVCEDLLVAYPAVDRARTRWLARLARERTVRVGLDSREAAEALSAAASEFQSTLGILVDLDLGYRRTGVQTADEAHQLARKVGGLPGLRLDGVMFFPGHIGGSPEEQHPQIDRARAQLEEVLDVWRREGLTSTIVSGGSTPTALQSHHFKHLTEIRSGTYVFNGVNELYGGYATLDDCAARVLATVVSTAVPGKVVLDGGSKTFTSDRCGPRPDSGHGLIVEYPEAKIVRLTEEHAEVDVSACARRPRIGERVSVVPNHICPCVNLLHSFWWWENNSAVGIRVDARGQLS